MPALGYSGSRRIPESDAGTVIPNLADKLVTRMVDDSTLSVENANITQATNGQVQVDVSLSITGTYGELATLETELATAIVGVGFEPDDATAKEALTLS